MASAHKNSPFAKYHINQGIVNIIFGVIMGIAWGIGFGIGTAFVFVFYPLAIIIWIISYLLLIPYVVLAVIGIINASKGEMKPLPFIGKFTILK